MFERFVNRRVEEALGDTPVVLIVSPRRAGKTTLVRNLEEAGRAYVTFDDPTALEASQADPTGFIRGLDRAIIDEVQRAPGLLLAIKKTVDEDYRPGRFLLTGSANVLTLPRVSDSLAGRVETIRMLPLARAEVAGRKQYAIRGGGTLRPAQAGHWWPTLNCVVEQARCAAGPARWAMRNSGQPRCRLGTAAPEC